METRITRDRLVAGLALIGIGLLALVAQFVEIEWLGLLVLPALGLIFLLWGILARNVGLLIPGGILSGIGLGIVLIEGVFNDLGDEASGGLFLLSFALGWGLITLLSAIFAGRTHWWPLIPGGILALVGGALLAGGGALDALDFVGKIWPLGLVAVGLYLIFRRKESPEVTAQAGSENGSLASESPPLPPQSWGEST